MSAWFVAWFAWNLESIRLGLNGMEKHINLGLASAGRFFCDCRGS